jgi:hypothetical protein
MKFESRYFDSIRIKPAGKGGNPDEKSRCEWPECKKPAKHRAPKGKGREGEYFNFCIEHVRSYNKSYNYFRGMSDDEISKFQGRDRTGHRPTWPIGSNPDGMDVPGHERKAHFERLRNIQQQFSDPHEIFGNDAERDSEARKPRRTIRNLERKYLQTLNLGDNATASEIKNRFKELAKRHHPDSSGGKGSQDKLREVIAAYKYLKKTGLC